MVFHMIRKILVVDDSATDLFIIKNMLNDFLCLTARDGEEALEMLRYDPDIHLVILDLNMPKMNGFEVLEILNSDSYFKHIRVIILTNAEDVEDEIKGLQMGAVDFIRKPINLSALKTRIDVHKKILELQHDTEDANKILDRKIAEATKALVTTRDIAIQALVGLIEVRNLESYNHIMRTQEMMSLLCNHLKGKKKFKNVLTDEYIQELVKTSALHDIGKVAISDSILLKPGKLTEDEFNQMKKHVDYGVIALKKELPEGEEVPSFIKRALEIIEFHHEKYDGTGYPKGLKGEDIPLPGRLMAIIDVFDALINERVYKKAYTVEESVKIIKENIGKHFDPDVATGFLEIVPQICTINTLYTQR